MKKLTLLLLAATTLSAFANTNSQSSWAVCSEPQNANLTQAQFEALAYVPIGGVGNVGETGKSTNVVNYPTWSDKVIQKAKGLTDAGSPTVECARDPGDPGQTILELGGAVGNVNNYAFKETRADGTIRYNRGLVTGPTYPGGQNEDFDLVVFTLALQQEVIVVKPTGGGVVGNPPVMTDVPVITGTAEVGETLTTTLATFTGDAPMQFNIQWFAGGVAIAGATANTLVLTAVHLDRAITVRITAVNTSGSAIAFSEPTTPVAA